MPWENPIGYTYDGASIRQHAPVESGVYGLYADDRWIYIGPSTDICRSLLSHLGGDNGCILISRPTHFVFERLLAEARVDRYWELIEEFHPLCA